MRRGIPRRGDPYDDATETVDAWGVQKLVVAKLQVSMERRM